METIVIEIPHGEDIVEGIIKYAQRRQTSITVLSGSGPISSVTLLQPISGAPNFSMEGPFDMTSLLGTYINANCDDVPPQFIIDPPHSSFSIFFTNNDGNVFGGIVGGQIIAAGVVYINAVITEGFDVVDDGSTESDSENDSN